MISPLLCSAAFLSTPALQQLAPAHLTLAHLTLANLTLAWRPFLDPIDAHSWWYLLLIPLALGISLAHRAVRLTDMNQYPRAVASLTAQIVVSIAGLGLAAYVIIQILVPALTPMPG